MDVVVVDHGPRSVVGISIPININEASSKLLSMLPGFTRDRVNKVLLRRPFKSMDELAAESLDASIFTVDGN